jgi:hypothetical protein
MHARNLFVVQALAFCALARSAAGAEPAATFDFGAVLAGTIVEHEFSLSNHESNPLRIAKAQMTPPLVATRIPVEIAPGAEAKIAIRLDTSRLAGAFAGGIVVLPAEPNRDELDLVVKGSVIPPVEVAPLPALFVSARRGEVKQASVEIVNHQSEPLGITSIEHSKGRFTTELATLMPGSRYRLTLTLTADGPAGRSSETIRIRTTSHQSPILEVVANTHVHERVYTFPDELDLGALRASDIRRKPGLLEMLAQTLMVYQEDGSRFHVRVSTDIPALALKAERGAKGDRYQVTATLLPDRLSAGALRGSVFIETNDREFPRLIVPVSAEILPGDAR